MKMKQLEELSNKVKAKEEWLQKTTEKITSIRHWFRYKNTCSKKKKSAKGKTSDAPQARVLYVTTVLHVHVDLIDKSPPRRVHVEAFKKAGITSTRLLDQAVVGVVKSCLTGPKQSPTRKNFACSLSVLKKYQMQRGLSRKFGVSRKLVNRAKK